MKNLFKKVLTIGAFVGAFATGYFVNESDSVKIDTPVQAETQAVTSENNNVKNGLNEIESGKRNVFTQYFTITAIDEKGTDVQNQYNESDTYYIDKQDYDLDFNDLEVGTKIAVTFDHDTTLTAVLDDRYIHEYKLVDADFYNVDIDQDKYIFGINNMYPNDYVVLEKEDLEIGDLVNVTFENENGDSVQKVEKKGKWKKQEIAKSQEKNDSENVEKLVQQNTEIVKENETLKNAVKQETQKLEKVNKNEETPKVEQKEEIKKESSYSQKDPNEGKQGYIQDGNGKWITESEYDDMAFKENAENDPNKNNPDYVQTEDGSFVKKDFWD